MTDTSPDVENAPIPAKIKFFAFTLIIAVLAMLFALDTCKFPEPKPNTTVDRILSLKGKGVVLSDRTPACSSRDDLATLEKMLNEGDREAAATLVDVGKCELLNAGETFTLEDYTFFGQAGCLRRRGQPECLWVSAVRLNSVSATQNKPSR